MDLVGEVVACLTYVDASLRHAFEVLHSRSGFWTSPEPRHIWPAATPSTGASIANPIREPRMATSTEEISN